MIDENIFELMKHSFGGAVHTVYVPSLKRSIPFKEPTVRESKMISKIVIANSDSQSIIYATTLALIKGLCVERDFDQYSINEFDRITILTNLFANNFISKQMGIRCPYGGCGHQFTYTVKHGDIIKAIDSMDISDIRFSNRTEDGEIDVKINYPTTKQYLEFLEFIDESAERSSLKTNITAKADKYEELNSAFSEIEKIGSANGKDGSVGVDMNDIQIAEMISKRKNSVKSTRNMDGIAGNIDMSSIKGGYTLMDTGDLYVREIYYRINGSSDENRIIFDNSIGFEDRERILGMFPMSFLTNENGSTMFDVATIELNNRMHKCIPTITCPKCGNNIDNRIGLYDFFTHG